MRGGWSRLGFILSPRGRHIGQGTANYCVMFPSDYVELLGIVDPNDFVQRLDAFLAQREGLMAAAFAPAATPEEVHAALLRRRLHPSEPRPLGRRLELAGGTVVPRFSLIALAEDETPGLDCFICAHLTPELMRRPEWLRPSERRPGIRGIHVLVENTAALLEPYDRLFGIQQVPRPMRSFAFMSAAPDRRSAHPTISGRCIPRSMSIPISRCPGSSRWSWGRPTRGDRRILERSQIAYGEMADGSFVVPASEATGAILFLS